MAYLNLNRDALARNYATLQAMFAERGIHWGVTTKLLCGNPLYLAEVLRLGAGELLDSRLHNLRVIKSLAPGVQTVYIKPPARDNIPEVVAHADVSFNTELETIRALSEEAGRQGKRHKVMVMIEMGDLREGVMRGELVDFYGSLLALPHIEPIGIGTNLNCLSGVLPSEDKLI